MKREDYIKELSSIDLCISNLVSTYDMGLQFDILTSEGAETNIGNMSSWPCYEFEITNDLRELIVSIQNGIIPSNDDMLKCNIVCELCKYRNFNSEYKVSNDRLNNRLNQVKTQLSKLDTKNDAIYAYLYIEEWNMDIKLFNSLEELRNYFKSQWSGSIIPYNCMTDLELEEWLNIAKEEEYDSFPIYS